MIIAINRVMNNNKFALYKVFIVCDSQSETTFSLCKMFLKESFLSSFLLHKCFSGNFAVVCFVQNQCSRMTKKR